MVLGIQQDTNALTGALVSPHSTDAFQLKSSVLPDSALENVAMIMR